MGSWNTLAIILARSQTGCRVISTPANRISPESTDWAPEIAFNSVDFPAPLEPITVTNCPFGIETLIPRNARVSIGVPGLNVMFRFRSEEHTSELQSRGHLVCRLLLEKEKTTSVPTS